MAIFLVDDLHNIRSFDRVIRVHEMSRAAGHVTLAINKYDEFVRRPAANAVMQFLNRYDFTRTLDDLRCGFANLDELDKAARAQAKRAMLAPFIQEKVECPLKPMNARVAGEDIRRFIPRRT